MGLLGARGASIIAVPILLNDLGPTLYGVWAIVVVFAGAQGLVDFGMMSATSRFVAEGQALRDRSRVLRVIAMSLAVYLLLSITVVAGVLVAADGIVGLLSIDPNARSEARYLLVLGALLFGISNVSALTNAVLIGQQRYWSSSFGRLLGSGAFLAALVIDAGRSSVETVAQAAVLMNVAEMTVWLPSALRGLPDRQLLDGTPEPLQESAISPATFRRLVAFGARMQVTVWSEFLMFQAPRLFAGAALGATAVVDVDLALRLGFLGLVVGLPLLPTIAPVTTAFVTSGGHGERLRSYAGEIGRFTTLALTASLGLLVVVGPDLVTVWVGPTVDTDTWVLRFFSAAILIHGLSGPPAEVAIGLGQPEILMRSRLWIVGPYLLLIYPVTRLGGLVGLSVLSLLAMSVGLVALLRGLQRVRGDLGTILRRDIVAALAVAAPALLLGAVVTWALGSLPSSSRMLLAGASTMTMLMVGFCLSGLVRRRDFHAVVQLAVSTLPRKVGNG